MFEKEKNLKELSILWDKKLENKKFTYNEKIRFKYLNNWYDILEAKQEHESWKVNQPI